MFHELRIRHKCSHYRSSQIWAPLVASLAADAEGEDHTDRLPT